MGKNLAFAIVGVFVWASFASAQMGSSNYQIRWDTFSTGGSDTSSSTSYQLHDTVESGVAGTSTSSSYQLDQGYRSGDFAQIIKFDLFATSSGTGRAAGVISGNTVTVSSTSGLVVGDYISVVEDYGTDNITAIGQIAVVGVGEVTVDEWKHAGTMPVLNASNDYVYELNGAAISFGSLDDTTVDLAVIGWEVTIDNSNGYVVQVVEDGNLRDGATSFSDVSDGTVTAGSEEYGARSSDTTLTDSSFDTEDTAITGTFQDIDTESTFSFESRDFLALKVAAANTSTAGSYGHIISVIASGNF